MSPDPHKGRCSQFRDRSWYVHGKGRSLFLISSFHDPDISITPVPNCNCSMYMNAVRRYIELDRRWSSMGRKVSTWSRTRNATERTWQHEYCDGKRRNEEQRIYLLNGAAIQCSIYAKCSELLDDCGWLLIRKSEPNIRYLVDHICKNEMTSRVAEYENLASDQDWSQNQEDRAVKIGTRKSNARPKNPDIVLKYPSDMLRHQLRL